MRRHRMKNAVTNRREIDEKDWIVNAEAQMLEPNNPAFFNERPPVHIKEANRFMVYRCPFTRFRESDTAVLYL